MKKIHDTLKTANNNSIAYIFEYSPHNKYNIIWFGGLFSDMNGTKAQAVSEYAKKNKINLCRFDYSGHGKSSKIFEDCNISQWLNDSLAVIDKICIGPQIFIGSSMGGWLSLLAALKTQDRVLGIILLEPAVDMTENLMWDNFSKEEKDTLIKNGYLRRQNEGYDSSYNITKQLITDGRDHLLLNGAIDLKCPIKFIHGMMDKSVPWELSNAVSDCLESDKIVKVFIKDGEHGLSRKIDLDYLFFSINEIISTIELI